ncbi:MAG: hypothetical protein EB051_03215 [Chlamydiia bacterium]|nr:hypothetical protein [Chlamydiia bacterium]
MFKIRLIFLISTSLCTAGILGEIINLPQHEKKVFSQNGEDGILDAIFNIIGETNRYYVEFGTENGYECNTRYLRETRNWTGLLMDGGYENKSINLHQEFITAENINYLFKKHNVPNQFDLLSIDIDFNDWYIWHAIEASYQPRVVVIEYNATHLPNEDRIVIYKPKGQWDGTNYFGASILALYNLGLHKGYSLVYANANGVNLFFIRNDVIEECKAEGIEFISINNVDAIYRAALYGKGPKGGHPRDRKRRRYVESSTILR